MTKSEIAEWVEIVLFLVTFAVLFVGLPWFVYAMGWFEWSPQ